MFNYLNLEPEQCEYVALGPASDVPSGERIFVEVNGQPVVIFNIAGKLFAIADLCSHDDGPLGDGEVEDFEVICPRHGARFDLRTGKAISLPAVVDIPAYPIRIVDGMIELGLPIQK